MRLAAGLSPIPLRELYIELPRPTSWIENQGEEGRRRDRKDEMEGKGEERRNGGGSLTPRITPEIQ